MAKIFLVFEGPYTILRRIGKAIYLLVDETTGNERGRFHACDLKRYNRHMTAEDVEAAELYMRAETMEVQPA